MIIILYQSAVFHFEYGYLEINDCCSKILKKYHGWIRKSINLSDCLKASLLRCAEERMDRVQILNTCF